MKILNIAVLSIVNLLSILCHTLHLIVIIDNFILSVVQHLKNLKFGIDVMQRNDQQNPGPIENREEQPLAEPMDADDTSDEEVTTEEEDSDMEEDYMGVYGGGTPAWLSSSSESDASAQSPKYALHLGHEQRQSMQKPIYKFQPLRLVKRNYKLSRTSKEYPLARSGHRVIASNSNLYSLGGYNPHKSRYLARRGHCLLFQELWCYNFATNRWKPLLNTDNASNMPVELASNALAIHNNVLISHGGTGYPFGQSCSNDCYVYTTGYQPLVTRLKVSGDLPTAQYGPGIVIHKDYLYTIGGTTGFDYSCDVYRLNMTTKVWENVYICRPEMRDDPEGRYRHELVYDGQHIYVLGGGTSHSVYDLQRIPAFNLQTNSWDYFDTLPDRTVTTTRIDGQDDGGYPQPRKCFSCVQHRTSNGDVEAFITGGMQADSITYFADIWKLNLRNKQWTWIRTASLPRPLYFHSAAHASNGCMYIFGGIEYSEDMRRRNDLYKMWMTIPKLSEICWDAVTYYNEKLNYYDRNTLLFAGIPERFVERLAPLHQRKSARASLSQFAIALLSKRPVSQAE